MTRIRFAALAVTLILSAAAGSGCCWHPVPCDPGSVICHLPAIEIVR